MNNRLMILLCPLLTFLAACTGSPAVTAAPEVPTASHTPEPTATTPVFVTDFKGIDGPPGQLVPDPSIAVGFDRVILITNASLAMFDKAGNSLETMRLHQFFLPVMQPNESSAGDVFALFDPTSKRFFLIEAAKIEPQTCTPGTCVGHMMLAVSKTESPAGFLPDQWYFYALDRYLEQTDAGTRYTTNWGDFDKLGMDDEVLVITSRMYNESNHAPQGSNIRILDKSRLVRGEALDTWTDFVDIKDPQNGRSTNRGVQPAMTSGGSGTFFLVSSTDRCGFVIWGIDNALASPTLTNKVITTDGNCEEPANAAQPNDGPLIDIKGGHNLSAVYRNGSLWIADILRADSGSSPISSIRWAQIDVSDWPDTVQLLQDGTFGADGTWHFYPAIMADQADNIAIVFGSSSSNEFASLNYTYRLSTDEVDTLRPSVLIKAGEASFDLSNNGRNRYGDYFTMALDPSDGSIWMYGQYAYTASEWGTWVGHVDLNGAGSSAQP